VPVDVFASSGGAVGAPAWIVDRPGDDHVLVAHERPPVTLLEDRQTALKVDADILETYQQRGYGGSHAHWPTKAGLRLGSDQRLRLGSEQHLS
jgi:hypothetical protein